MFYMSRQTQNKNKLHVLPPHQNFRGLSYGEWAALWWKWLLSDDLEYRGDMFFLRGNVDYRPLGGDGGPAHIDPKGYYKAQETVYRDTPIFFPVSNALFVKGELDDGIAVETEQDARQAARRHTYEVNSMWATVRRSSDPKPTKLVKNLHDYLVESPQFELKVSDKSLLRSRMETPIEPGSYYPSVTVGYYVLISSLPPSVYRFRFGSAGRGSYHTDSFYDITVQGKQKKPLDESDKKCLSKDINSLVPPIL
jgi:hypothetical protein